MAKHTSKRAPDLRAGLTHALESALSREELSRVAAGALLAMDEAGRQRMLEQLPPDTAEAILPILEAPRSGESVPATAQVGKAKVRETWQGLWAEWNECIDESGLEKGRYVYQDAHWEPPYLDRSGVVDDLEAIAKRMRELTGRLWADGLDPERSILDEVREAANCIGAGLPEWFNGEGVDFGPQVTACLLEWEWRVAQREGLDAFGLVERIRNLERSLHDAGLDGGAIVAFVAAMPQEDQRGVFEGLKSYRASATWSEVLADAHSGWFRLHQRLARKWDRARHDESCRTHIGQDWTLALPLVSGRIRKKAHSEALVLIDEAVRSLLHLEQGCRWDPTQDLLVRRRSFGGHHQTGDQAFRLLTYWQKAAAALGDDSVAAALGVQCAIGAGWEDWDRAIEAFKKAKPSCEALFAAWQSMVARESMNLERGYEDRQLEWVCLLAGTAKGDMDAPAFLCAMHRWLAQVDKVPGGLERCKGSLATLLLDLDSGQPLLKKQCPRLTRLLQREHRGGDVLDRSRRRWLERLGGHVLLPEVLEVLKKHAAALVPDPADAYASYDGCSEWMAAVHELSPDEYGKLLRRWQEVHHRRRNLWKALTARGLSGLGRSRDER